MAKIDIWDRTLKVIAHDYALEFIRLIWPRTNLRVIGTEENVELALPTQHVDFVHRVADSEQEYLLHIEFQGRHTADFPMRMYTYSAALTQKFALPVLAVAVYVHRRAHPLPRAYEVKINANVVNRFSYPIIKLWEYEADIRAGYYRPLAPLLISMAQERTVDVLATERDLIMQEQNQHKRAHLLAMAALVASRYLDQNLVWDFFIQEVGRMEMLEELQTMPLIGELLTDRYQQGIEQGMEQGMEQGIEQGMEQGVEQGIKTALRQSVAFILGHRFGATPEQLPDQLETMNLAQLQDLQRAALDVNSLDEFNAYLSALPENPLINREQYPNG